jgi:hypothetical protein
MHNILLTSVNVNYDQYFLGTNISVTLSVVNVKDISLKNKTYTYTPAL